MNVLSFGEVLWDVYPDEQFLGGAPMNFAAHIVKNGHQAALLSAVGNDERGEKTLRSLASFGIDTRFIRIHPTKPTGTCFVTLDDRSQPTYSLSEDTAWDDIACDAIPHHDVLYFGTLALRSAQNRACLTHLLESGTFREVLADVNIRAPFYSADSIMTALTHATILKISDEELPIILQEAAVDVDSDPLKAAKALAAAFPQIRILIITRGAKGAIALDTRHQTLHGTPAVKADVVSTVGAGDSFAAAFLARYTDCGDIAAALAYAARVASFVVSHTEAVPDYGVTTSSVF